MGDRRPIPLLGRLAVHFKMITMDQLAEITRSQARGDPRRIGDILVEDGFITREYLAKLLKAQKERVAQQRAKAAAQPSGVEPQEPQARRARGENASPEGAQPDGTERSRSGEPSGVGPSERKALEPPRNQPASSEGARRERKPEGRAASGKAEGRGRRQAGPYQASRPESVGQAERSSEQPTVAEFQGDRVHLENARDVDREALDTTLRDAVERGASDIHIHAGDAIRLRIDGRIAETGSAAPSGASLERMAVAGLSPEEHALLEEHGEIDFRYLIDGVARFRANAYRQQRGVDVVFRAISLNPPSLEDLGLPRTLARCTSHHQGLVLVTGPAGCGKSSTLAALVDLINEERREHILSIEDPIEFVHPSKRCLVNQRSVKRHTESFARALRAALREDPDVIVIGELRDLESISLALTAAETGHLVLATLHTENAIRTINRIVGAFPSDQQSQIRSMIADSLRTVISQRLLPRADGAGRVVALETLIVTKAVANLIRENKTFQIHSILQTGAAQGMGLLDYSIRDHVKSGVVELEEARRFCQDSKVLAA